MTSNIYKVSIKLKFKRAHTHKKKKRQWKDRARETKHELIVNYAEKRTQEPGERSGKDRCNKREGGGRRKMN